MAPGLAATEDPRRTHSAMLCCFMFYVLVFCLFGFIFFKCW